MSGRDFLTMVAAPLRLSYGSPERFYDTNSGTTKLVCKRYETWRDESGKKWGRWDYVPWPPPVTGAEDGET